MKIISHRGNLNGSFPTLENAPTYIDSALKLGVDVEIDLRIFAGKLYLGHDYCQYKVELDWLKERSQSLWCHAKNVMTLQICLENDLHCFMHDSDKAVVTSKGYIWTYPGHRLVAKSICVLPEREDFTEEITGVCTDYVEWYL